MKTDYDRFAAVLKNITLSFQPWEIVLRRDDVHVVFAAHEPRCYLQIQDPNGKCNTTGEPMAWHGRKWMLSPHMTETEVVQTAFKAYMAAVEHEAREGFLWHGVTIFDPHINVNDLVALRLKHPLDGRK